MKSENQRCCKYSDHHYLRPRERGRETRREREKDRERKESERGERRERKERERKKRERKRREGSVTGRASVESVALEVIIPFANQLSELLNLEP